MKLTLGFSTCPNDTFIFDAMVHQKIDTEGLTFTPFLGDVEELNRKSFANELQISKLSFHAYAYCAENYAIMNSGAALGYKNGPLLISKKKIYPDEIKELKIAIPGKYTTANLLLSIAFPQINEKNEYLFSQIEDVILSNETDAGVIIHENRFTYEKRGLKKIIDLGEWWENETKMPIPLGCICVQRNLGKDIQLKINRVLKRSVEFALKNPKESIEYCKKYAQDMHDDIMMKHIRLYVNDFTVDLGEKGKQAINLLFNKAIECEVIPKINNSIFIE